MTDDTRAEMSERKYPDNADILLAARDDSSRYYFAKKGMGGVTSVPATNADLARELAADEFPSVDIEDFHEISREEEKKIRRWQYAE